MPYQVSLAPLTYTNWSGWLEAYSGVIVMPPGVIKLKSVSPVSQRSLIIVFSRPPGMDMLEKANGRSRSPVELSRLLDVDLISSRLSPT